MKKAFVLGGVMVLALAVVGYIIARNELLQKETVYTGPIEQIKVGNVGEYTIFNLIAEDKGYFQENGLDASIQESTSGPASLAGLLAGDVDVTIAADFVGVRNILNDADIRILAAVNQHRVFQLAGRKDAGIHTPANLKGKRIGVTENSAGEYFMGDFLIKNGLALSDVTLVDLTPADMLTQLEAGIVDAIAVFEPHIYKLKQSTTHELIIWEIQGDQNVNALVYATTPFIEENPYLIERYLAALVAAEEYYKDNPGEVKEFVAEKLNYEKAYVDYSWPRFTHEISLSRKLLSNLESEARWSIENQLTTKTEIPNFFDYIYFDALEKLLPGKVLVNH